MTEVPESSGLSRSTDDDLAADEEKEDFGEDVEILDLLADRVSQRLEVSHRFSGPIPSPFVLAKYDKISPGSAQKFFEAFEKQVNHRIETEKIIVRENFFCQKAGLILGFLIAIAGLGSSVHLALNDRQATACVIGGGTLDGLVAAFVTGKAQVEKEEDNGQKDENDVDASDED